MFYSLQFRGIMFCSKCGGDFKEIVHDEINAHQCKTCLGIFFEAQPDQKEISDDLAISVDKGDAAVGKIYDLLMNVNCPKCEIAMATIVDTDQDHIHYEICRQCYGVYFDAGEFSDFVIKSENLSRIRDIMWKKK